MPDTTISIPLNRLAPAPENSRKTGAGKAADAELRASIRHRGVLQNLNVRIAEGASLDVAADRHDRYLVVSGLRRLTALQALAKDGEIPEDHGVYCALVDLDDARETSLAENVVRSAMHPADQVEAFSALVKSGVAPADVAARFGVSERLVDQRARLGGIAPKILKAYRAGKIDLESLQAFAATPDRKRQTAAFDRIIKGHSWEMCPQYIRPLLFADAVPGISGIAMFVGVRAYEAAGGRTEGDLFADEDRQDARTMFLDPEILGRLADEKLEAERLRILDDEGWKWVEAVREWPYEEQSKYGLLNPSSRTYGTDEEKAALAKLKARMDKTAGGPKHYALVGEHDRLARRLRFGPKQKAKGGAVVTIGHNGGFDVGRGMIHPDDGGRKSETAAQREPAIEKKFVDLAVLARKEHGLNQVLDDELAWIRTALVKQSLAIDFGAAFDLLTYELCHSLFSELVHVEGGGHVWHQPYALKLAPEDTGTFPVGWTEGHEERWRAINPGIDLMAERLVALPLDWMAAEDPWAAFLGLPACDRKALFSAAVAVLLKRQLSYWTGRSRSLEGTAERLDVPFGLARPTFDYWNRVPKAKILEEAAATLGDEWVKQNKKLKKGELAQAAAEAFADKEEWSFPGFVPEPIGKE